MPIIVCLILLSALNVWPKGPSTNLRLLTQNIQCNPATNASNLRKLVTFANSQNIDVLAIQEFCTDLNHADFRNLDILKASFPYLYLYFTHPAYDKYAEYLIVASKSPPIKYLEGKLPRSPLQRGYQALLFSDIAILNTHLSHVSDSIYRINQINFLIALTDKFKTSNIVLMGDFNSSPFSPESEAFWQNFWRPLFPYATYFDKTNNRHTWIDGLWLKGQGIHFSQQSTIPVPRIDSDHRGISAQILLNSLP